MEDLTNTVLMDMAPILKIQEGFRYPEIEESPLSMIMGVYALPRDTNDNNALYPCPRFIMISGENEEDLEKRAVAYVKSEIKFMLENKEQQQ